MATNRLGAALNDPDVLPCGCMHWTSGDQFYYVPCSASCGNYRFAIEESARQGKPIEIRR